MSLDSPGQHEDKDDNNFVLRWLANITGKNKYRVLDRLQVLR